MKKKSYKTIRLIALIFILASMFIGCSKNKDVIIGDGKKEEELSKKQSLKVTERKLSIPEGYRVVFWKNDKEILLTKEKNKLYIFNTENNEVKDTSIDGEIVDDQYMSGKDGEILGVKDFKLFIYDVEKNSKTYILDLKDVKNEVETKYSIESDAELSKNIKVNFVKGNNNKIFIITKGQYDGYHKNRVRIVDRYTKKVVTSEEYTDSNLIDVLSYDEKYYVVALFNKLYEAVIGENDIKLEVITKNIEGANSGVHVTKDGYIMQGSEMRQNKGEFKFYNLLEKKDEKGFYFQDREKLSSVVVANYNIKNNLILFTKSYKNRNEGEKDFIGWVNGNDIDTIYKINDYENKDNTESWIRGVFNEQGNKLILTRRIYSTQGSSINRTENILLEFN